MTGLEQHEWRAATWPSQHAASALPPTPAEEDLVLTPDMIEPGQHAEDVHTPAEPEPPAPEPAAVAPEPVAFTPEPAAAPEPMAIASAPPPPTKFAASEPPRGAASEPIERGDETGRAQFFAGKGVKLKAEVSGCDVFRIEGDFDGSVVARRMFIAPTGVFKGTGTVEEAVVEGRIEGSLIVTGVLALRATGRVTGSISYGLIEIERGGHLHGDIVPRAGEQPPSRSAPLAAGPVPQPSSQASSPMRVSAPKPPIAAAPSPAMEAMPVARKPVLASLSLGPKRAPN